MKILQVVPQPGLNSKLKTALKNTERTLRGPHTTFHRMREGRWKHVKYSGWIQWDEAAGGCWWQRYTPRSKTLTGR
jgi:hypothetical protein